MSVEQSFADWMRRTVDAARHLCRDGELYGGKEGCKRFARECAPAILDFGEYGMKNMGATYGAICVIAYNLCPPVDAKQWFTWMREKIEEVNKHG